MEIRPYTRAVQVYETDMMGIVHHANHIHWLEEARIDLLEQLGYPYGRFVEEGLGSPVLAVSLEYKSPARFPDKIQIQTQLLSFNGVIMEIGYTLTKEDGTLVATGTTRHTFVDREGHVVRLRRDYPELYALLKEETP